MRPFDFNDIRHMPTGEQSTLLYASLTGENAERGVFIDPKKFISDFGIYSFIRIKTFLNKS